ncbi:TRAP-type C4-dicarboxylate transport system, small permease component [Alteribacillus persepolensis]|uniref:TRAP-type C4-dicarboxylate transport system, small permease component n=1 Tax=Alteribacillus persepolensis TaxID=568899 RepID=A0A1G8B2I4_9BACI|nr:TRAP transporter small permease [Alteribacillus persepolensis]SDH27341.1 TRAP-type C4-dicarboxylate transport system, small permease component [Alteribacillus persepolensis]
MKVLKWLDEHLEEYPLILLSSFTVVIIFTQVIMRYVFGNSLSWSEEAARYAFIWMIYLGISYGVKKRKHLNVDAFSILFGKKGKVILGMISTLSFLVFALVIAWYGFDIVVNVTRESAAMQLPMGWVYAAPVTGMVLTTFRLIQQFIRQVHEWKQLHRKNEYEVREEAI